MKERNLNMISGHPGRLLMAFALPLMAGNVFQQLYTVVDTAIVGRGVGMSALAALGTVDWMNWMYLGIIQGITQGFSVLMSQRYGEGNEKALRRVLGVSVRLSVAVGVLAALVGQLALGGFLELLRVPEELRPQAVLYSRIFLLGIPGMMFFNLTASILQAVGDSRTPLQAMTAAAVTNIALDCLAVFVLGWGVAGAAGATVISQLLAGTLCAVRISKTPMVRVTREDLGRDRQLAKQLMGLGIPLALQNIIISVGGMAVQSVVNGFDTSFIAGFTATNKMYGILEIAALSYGYAITTYVGQNYGALRYDRIKNGVRWAVFISLATSAVIAAVMFLFGRDITMLFISAESAAEAAAAGDTAYRYLCVMAGCLPVLYLLYVYRAALQGMGDTRIPLLSGVVDFVMRVGASMIIGYTLWRNGIFYAEVLAWSGAAVLLASAYYYRAGKLK